MTTAITIDRATLKAMFPAAAEIIDKPDHLERLLNSPVVKRLLPHACYRRVWYEADYDYTLTPWLTTDMHKLPPHPPTLAAIRFLISLRQTFTINSAREPNDAEKLLPGLRAYAGADGRSVKIGDELQDLQPVPAYAAIMPKIQEFVRNHADVTFHPMRHNLGLFVAKDAQSRQATADLVKTLAAELGDNFITKEHPQGFTINPKDCADKVHAHGHVRDTLQLAKLIPLYMDDGNNGIELLRHVKNRAGFAFKVWPAGKRGTNDPIPDYADEVLYGPDDVALLLMLCAAAIEVHPADALGKYWPDELRAYQAIPDLTSRLQHAAEHLSGLVFTWLQHCDPIEAKPIQTAIAKHIDRLLQNQRDRPANQLRTGWVPAACIRNLNQKIALHSRLLTQRKIAEITAQVEASVRDPAQLTLVIVPRFNSSKQIVSIHYGFKITRSDGSFWYAESLNNSKIEPPQPNDHSPEATQKYKAELDRVAAVRQAFQKKGFTDLLPRFPDSTFERVFAQNPPNSRIAEADVTLAWPDTDLELTIQAITAIRAGKPDAPFYNPAALIDFNLTLKQTRHLETYYRIVRYLADNGAVASQGPHGLGENCLSYIGSLLLDEGPEATTLSMKNFAGLLIKNSRRRRLINDLSTVLSMPDVLHSRCDNQFHDVEKEELNQLISQWHDAPSMNVPREPGRVAYNTTYHRATEPHPDRNCHKLGNLIAHDVAMALSTWDGTDSGKNYALFAPSN